MGWAVEAESNGRIDVRCILLGTLAEAPAQYDAVMNSIAGRVCFSVQGYTANRFNLTQNCGATSVLKVQRKFLLLFSHCMMKALFLTNTSQKLNLCSVYTMARCIHTTEKE